MLVYSKGEEKHEIHLRIMLGLLKEKHLYAKYSKCEFWLFLVSLGNMISKEGFIVNLQKVEAIKNWARPMNVIEIHSFVGLASYYHQFLEGFATIALHMTRLTSKEVPFVWDDKCEE